jgi:transcriptional regulator with XRE-family HTH domain
MELKLNTAVKELRRALGLSQQAFATQLGLSIRAVVNYEKDRAPSARALFQLEKLASVNEHPEHARVFREALGSELGLGMSERPPLSAKELYLDRAFRRCVFENPRSPAALKICGELQDYVEQIKKEDEHSSRVLDKRRKAQ